MLTVEEMCHLHREVAAATGFSSEVRDPACLVAVLARPYTTRQGIPAYPTLFGKAAVLVQGLVRDRPFTEGNRPAAILALAVVLYQRGYRLQAEAQDVLPLLKGIEIGFTTWQRIARWIKAHAVPLPPASGPGGAGGGGDA